MWRQYTVELADLIREVRSGRVREVQGRLAKRVRRGDAGHLRDGDHALSGGNCDRQREPRPRASVLRIRSEDTIGFLYELANALALAGIDIVRLIVASSGHSRVRHAPRDRRDGRKDHRPEPPTRAAGGRSCSSSTSRTCCPARPIRRRALLHFRDFLEHLFQQPDWLARAGLAGAVRRAGRPGQALLGVSDFLWEDFLRLQHVNLFPVVTGHRRTRTAQDRGKSLAAELQAELAAAATPEERRARLNAFKDREMFRADMRHILGQDREFGQFSEELGDVAEVVVAAALDICRRELERALRRPRGARADGKARFCVCAWASAADASWATRRISS